MQRMNIKCCHCGDFTPFITEENIEVIPQVNLTRTDMDILDHIAEALAECGYLDMCGFLTPGSWRSDQNCRVPGGTVNAK